MSSKRVLISDVDNTLLDWVNIWYVAFSAMLSEIERLSGIDANDLKPQIRAVHQRHRTSEYALLIRELPLLWRGSVKETEEFYQPAIKAYRDARSAALKLYPTVMQTLQGLSGKGVSIVCYTESMAFYTAYRFKKTGLDSVVDYLYSPPDHDFPADTSREDLRKRPSEFYRLLKTVHRHTPIGAIKPNTDVLRSIINDLGCTEKQCVYVGDSLHKDIAMAKDVGVDSAWAKYGLAQQTDAYRLLREVTHWSDEDVEFERKVRERDVRASVVLETTFEEVLSHFSFGGSSQ